VRRGMRREIIIYLQGEGDRWMEIFFCFVSSAMLGDIELYWGEEERGGRCGGGPSSLLSRGGSLFLTGEMYEDE